MPRETPGTRGGTRDAGQLAATFRLPHDPVFQGQTTYRSRLGREEISDYNTGVVGRSWTNLLLFIYFIFRTTERGAEHEGPRGASPARAGLSSSRWPRPSSACGHTPYDGRPYGYSRSSRHRPMVAPKQGVAGVWSRITLTKGRAARGLPRFPVRSCNGGPSFEGGPPNPARGIGQERRGPPAGMQIYLPLPTAAGPPRQRSSLWVQRLIQFAVRLSLMPRSLRLCAGHARDPPNIYISTR